MNAGGKPPGRVGSFAGRLARPGSFTVALSLRAHYDAVPRSAQALRSCLDECAGGGLAQGFFASDRPALAGEPSAETLAGWILERGGDPVLSLSLAAPGRAEVLDRVRSWQGAGVRDLLVVTGDYPGAREQDGAHFDLDSLQALLLLGDAGKRGGIPGEVRAGCVVSPFKALEAEALWQYARLRRKIAAGAGFIVSQAGYDPRAWDELFRFCRLEPAAPPVVGTVLVPDAKLARRIAAGALPGVSIAPHLLERFVSGDGRAGLLLAASAVAVLRGLGYRGVLLGGRPLAPAEVHVILDEAGRLAPRWEECLGEFGKPPRRFTYFRRDERTGLNEDLPAKVRGRAWPRPMYLFSYAVDHVAFGPVEPVFRLLTRACRFCDAHPAWGKALWLLEWLSKVPLYRCRMCGDCTLYACGFFCSESGCPKRMVNGPCGGSRDGRCEVPGAGRCLWVKVYDRLKSRAERPDFTAATVPAKNRDLEGTCSWINYCLGRDHRKLPGGPG